MARCTTEFFCIPAGSIGVHGVPARAPVTLTTHETLSSLAGIFTVSADTLWLIGDLLLAPEPVRLAA